MKNGKVFCQRVKDGGSKSFQETVQVIADGSGMAHATAHRAIKRLAEQNKIVAIKSRTRRVANELFGMLMRLRSR